MEFFAERLDRLREALPDLAITSDVIVGFPGETEEEFMETYNFIRDQVFLNFMSSLIQNEQELLQHVWKIKLMKK